LDGRKSEDKGLRPVVKADIGERRVYLLEARIYSDSFSIHINPVEMFEVLKVKESLR
jgi:hypothetical protein